MSFFGNYFGVVAAGSGSGGSGGTAPPELSSASLGLFKRRAIIQRAPRVDDGSGAANLNWAAPTSLYVNLPVLVQTLKSSETREFGGRTVIYDSTLFTPKNITDPLPDLDDRATVSGLPGYFLIQSVEDEGGQGKVFTIYAQKK